MPLYTLIIGSPDGDHLENFFYTNSLGRKCDNRFLIDKELLNEINDLNKNGMLVYHYEWNEIICVEKHLYVFYLIVLTNLHLCRYSTVRIVHVLDMQAT